jgi:hypothetical protein
VSRKSAEKKHAATANEHQRQFVKLIEQFSYGHHLHTVFSDFVELAALTISNSVDRSQYEPREKRYLEIVGKYSKEEVARFPQMFAALVLSFELRVAMMKKASSSAGFVGSGLTDILGQTYMMLELGNARAGQFFTPYHVSRLMMMTIGDAGEAVQRHGFMRLQEPACGAGGMVIAAAESLHDAGLNYQQAMHATCVDIDPCCVHMAYVQLSLLHIPAVVVHGNALSMEVWGTWYTPAHIVNGWRWKLRRREQELADSAEEGRSDAAVETETSSETSVVATPAVTPLEIDAGDVAVLERESPAAVIDKPSLSDTTVLNDLFEAVAASATSSGSIFQRIDQMTLF